MLPAQTNRSIAPELIAAGDWVAGEATGHGVDPAPLHAAAWLLLGGFGALGPLSLARCAA
jgi:hypothetical protein